MFNLNKMAIILMGIIIFCMNTNLRFQLILMMALGGMFLVKRFNLLYLIIIFLCMGSWNYRINHSIPKENAYYEFKILKMGSLGKIIKVDNKVSSEKSFINLSYLDFSDGLYDVEVVLKKKTKKNKVFYYEVEVLSYSNHWSNKYRIFLRSKIEKITENLETEAFLKSIVLGEKKELTKTLIEKFNYLGVSHILVISGLHMGILLYLLMQIGNIIKLKYHTKYFMMLFFMTIYTIMLGFTPSVQRAYFMTVVYLISKILFEKNDIKKSFWIALIISLLYNPLALLDISFQLSYMAVFSIIYVYPKINIVNNVLLKYLSLSLVIQILLTPLFLYYFQTLYTVSFIINLLIVPLATILTNISFVGVLLSFFNIEIMDLIIKKIVSFLYGSLNGFVELFSKVPLLKVEVKNKISLFFILWIYLGLVYFFYNFNEKKSVETELKK